MQSKKRAFSSLCWDEKTRFAVPPKFDHAAALSELTISRAELPAHSTNAGVSVSDSQLLHFSVRPTYGELRCFDYLLNCYYSMTGIKMQGVEASAYDPVRKLWATEGELASSRESLLAIGGMRAGTRL